ncbi:hypothetical protein VTI74DRAFT_2050 [Chaetomium olivicolor]
MSRREGPNVASVEDADESGNIIEETARYASSIAPSSPAKEQPNTSRTRRDRSRRDSSSPLTTAVLTDSDTTTVQSRKDSLKKPSKDREKSLSSSKKALMASRPSVKHAKTTPTSIPRRDEASYYGVDPTITSATSRPRAPRPNSFFAAPPPSRPPPQSNARFYAGQPPGPIPPFPPPSPWIGPGPGPGPIPGPMAPHPFAPPPSPLVMHHGPPPPHSDYFAGPRPLEHRFGPGTGRPMSAMGDRPPRAIEYDYEEEAPFLERAIARRPSTTTRKVSKHDDDRRSMPPPPRRPASARPPPTNTLAFRPPPSTPARRGAGYDDDDLDHHPFFNDLSPHGAPLSSSFEPFGPSPFQPRPRFREDLGYSIPDYHTEVASKNRRRNSYYGGQSASSGSAYEDRLRQAARYQDDVTGGPGMQLTAESLRRAGRSGTSSRSTHSSGSHDESEYRQSATTRTTRSTAPNAVGADEDFTIRVKGGAVFKFGNSEMQCQDGAEINIISRGGTAAAEVRTTIGGESDRASSYMDPHEDRRTRVDIPNARARAQSRARSRARSFSRAPPPQYGSSKYDAIGVGSPGTEYDVYTTYGSPLPPPPPPEYPVLGASYGSYRDGYFGGP